ncbi:MAG: tyrosine-type recombinase/integrase [Clostridia bacterium]
MSTIVQNKFDNNLISEAQYNRVNNTLKNIFKCEIVNKNIENIKPEELQRFINTFKDYSDSSIKKIIGQFRQAFQYAFDRGYITRNPMAQVIRPKSNKPTKVIRAMTLDEENKFVRYLQGKTIDECPYKNTFLIQLFMGLRIGECLALDNGDIDLQHGMIYIHKTLTNGSGEEIKMSNSPKTQAGNRYVPIPDSLYPYLIEQIEYSETQKNNEEKLLFKPPQNKYTDSKNVNRALLKILKNLNIEHMSSHSLRHTYATRAIEAKITPVVLQTLMGHTDISTTIDIYTDVFDEFKDNELEKVNEYYTKNNLLQEKKSNDITKDNIIKLSEFKSNIIYNKTAEDKLNESLENYER